ncbi:MAG: FGGY family carbohydrate kinase [Enterocloster clostridioformis]
MRGDLPHRQIINDAGWVSHDLNEIYANTLKVVRDVIEKAGIRREQVAGLGISNQRETSAGPGQGRTAIRWRMPSAWQCSRAKDICARVEESGKAEWVRRTTGINLSPFFPASNWLWFMENVKKNVGDEGWCVFFWVGGR